MGVACREGLVDDVGSAGWIEFHKWNDKLRSEDWINEHRKYEPMSARRLIEVIGGERDE